MESRVSVEDAIKEMIDEAIEEFDFDESFRSWAMSDSAFDDEVESTIERRGLKPDMDEYVEKGDLEDQTGEVIRGLLESLPEDEGNRCAIGRAFTEAVRKVLADSATREALGSSVSESAEPSPETPSILDGAARRMLSDLQAVWRATPWMGHEVATAITALESALERAANR